MFYTTRQYALRRKYHAGHTGVLAIPPQGSHDLRYVSSGPRGLNSGLAALCCTLTTFSSHRLHHQRSFTRVIKRGRERETTRTKNHAARTPLVYSSRIKKFHYLQVLASVQIRPKDEYRNRYRYPICLIFLCYRCESRDPNLPSHRVLVPVQKIFVQKVNIFWDQGHQHSDMVSLLNLFNRDLLFFSMNHNFLLSFT